MPEKRDFDSWFRTFKEGITPYYYYTKFKKVYENVDGVRDGLEKLNVLIGDQNIEDDFVSLIKSDPEVLGAVSILLAIRKDGGENTYIYCKDDEWGDFEYNFNPKKYTRDDIPYDRFCRFMDKTGLFDLMKNRKVSNLVDYVTGIEVGLDSNARKNRSGDLMEEETERHIKEAGFIFIDKSFAEPYPDRYYYKELASKDITKKFGLDLSALSNNGFSAKRFDFVVKTPSMVYGIETNFYAASGSKPDSISGDYTKLAECARNVNGFTFVWFTDGRGWTKSVKYLIGAFNSIDNLYNIADMENGIMKKIFV